MKFSILLGLIIISLNLYSQCIAVDPQKLSWNNFSGQINPNSPYAAYTFVKITMSMYFDSVHKVFRAEILANTVLDKP